MDSQATPFDEFPPDVRKDVEGLIHLGSLSSDVEFCGHTFGLRTLRISEELAAAKVAELYKGTLKEAHALMTAEIGLALTYVDSDESFCPQATPDEQAFARARFHYMGKWHWPTIDFLYGEYVQIKERQINAIRQVQDLSPRSRRTSSPSPDSLIAPAIFDAEAPWEPVS